MKSLRSRFAFLVVILITVLLLTACGNKPPQETVVEKPATRVTEIKSPVLPAAKTGFTEISDLADAWNDLYKQNEKAINDYEGMIMMELVTPGLAFVSGVQYDLLNMENKDGRFTGELVLAGYHGFVEKQGSKITFGYDEVMTEDGFGPLSKAGDRRVESGIFETSKEYYKSESYTERGGAKLTRYYYEFKRLPDGSIICFALSGGAMDAMGKEAPYTTFAFIRSGKERYDFAIAKAKLGPEFNVVSLVDETDLKVEKAVAIFEAKGFTITATGGIKNGKLFVND